MRRETRAHFTRETAEPIAIGALAYLAQSEAALARFLSLTGIGPMQMRRAASDPGFLAGVLDYFLADEALLVAFAASAGLPAGDIAAARRAFDAGGAP